MWHIPMWLSSWTAFKATSFLPIFSLFLFAVWSKGKYQTNGWHPAWSTNPHNIWLSLLAVFPLIWLRITCLTPSSTVNLLNQFDFPGFQTPSQTKTRPITRTNPLVFFIGLQMNLMNTPSGFHIQPSSSTQ